MADIMGGGNNQASGDDVVTRAEHLVRQIDTVNSNDELIRALESLKRTLLDDPTKECCIDTDGDGVLLLDHDDETTPTSTNGAPLRQAVASALLHRAIISGSAGRGGNNKLQEALHAVLFEGCGVGNSLLAAMEVLVSAANGTTTRTKASPGTSMTEPKAEDDVSEHDRRSAVFPEEALTIISLVLLKSEARLTAFLIDLPLVAQLRGSADGASSSRTNHFDLEAQYASFLGTWCGQVVLFSRVIANACHTNRHPLPLWAVASSSSSGWEPRLVDCAIRACSSHFLQEMAPDGAAGASIEPGTSNSFPSAIGLEPIEMLYLRELLRVLLSRGGGSSGVDSAAIGIRRAYDKLLHGQPRSESTICRAVVHALLYSVPNSLDRKREARSRPFSSLQLAPLCRALFLLELKRNKGNSDHGSVNGSEGACEEPWEWTIVRPILVSSKDAQDLFVQQVLLASSVPQNAGTRLARLLHSVQRDDDGTGVDREKAADRERDDASSEVEDSVGDAQQCRDSLLRQVHRVAVLWSTALGNGIQMHQQHALTCFLQESLMLLSEASPATSIIPGVTDRKASDSPKRTEDLDSTMNVAPDLGLLDALTSGDSLATLMNGVSERLQSTNPSIRRDGMLIGQALGEYVLHQSVVFDELKTQPEAKETETDHDGRPSSPCSELPLLSSRRMVRRRRVHAQTDPDALYLSESESSGGDSTGNEMDSTGGWSDDSDWDEEQYKDRRYDVDDDEDDLREVPLPLYLQDCLDLLRTSETVDAAAASHLAALQALPKLVRERPADLADFGPLIAKQLVAMENKFHIDDFDTMVLKPLCALVAEEPLNVGNALIEDMFRDGSLYNRSLALAALNDGAWELSGNARLRNPLANGDSPMRPLEGPRTFGKRSLVSIDSEGATRRWGRNRVSEAPGIIENRFAAIAPIWFYGMIRLFWDRVDDSSLWSGHVGSLFLTSFIQTLSIIVESCGPHQPVSQMLARDLLTLVWNFRNAEVAEVRHSVLLAVGTSLATLSEDSVLRLLLDNGVADLPQYLHLTSTSDCDPQCRALAGNIASAVSTHVSAISL